MPNPARCTIALAVLAAAIVAVAVALDLSSVAAQSEDEQSGRIVARRLDDGRTEFGWQPAGGERVLPRARYFPAEVGHQRWLNSSPVEVGGAEIGRINARRLSDGRIEFAFTPTEGERIEPSARYFPVDARVGRWLRSTEITISAAPTSGFVAISAGARHTCAIRTSGEITCWGGNSSGEGDAPAGSFSAVSAGSHTCGLRESGAIECWGWNYSGQTDAPTGSFSAVSVGGSHTCGLRESGAIECWGLNTRTQRTWNAEEETFEVDEVYVGQIDAPAGSFSAVSAGIDYTCAIRAGSGAIECWGGSYSNIYHPPPPAGGSFTAISAGSQHTCGLRESGAIECWWSTYGWSVGDYGQTIAPAGSFTAVAAGGEHTCGLRESGAIECWGNNYDEPLPESISGFVLSGDPTGSFSAVSAGGEQTCGLRESGEIECWGRLIYGYK